MVQSLFPVFLFVFVPSWQDIHAPSHQDTKKIRTCFTTERTDTKTVVERAGHCYTNVYPPRAVEFFKSFHSHDGILERSKKGAILVAEQNGNVISTAALVENEIYGVFVEPKMQGHGHGRAIMRALETRAMAKGHSEVALSVSLPSRKFYEGLGYEILHEAHIDVGEGQRLDFWKAKKSLQ